VGLVVGWLGSVVRPTREGRVTPFRAGLLTVGLGVNPDAPDEDPEPPIDWAASSNQGQAFVPFLNSGDAAVVQYKTGLAPAFGAPVTVTLDNAPTIGNILVLCAIVDDDNGPVLTIDNGTWVQAGSTVYSGNGTNWPNRMYYQTVDAGTTAATTIDSSGGATDTGTLKVGIIELSGVDTIDQTASTTNSSTTTATLTPTASQTAIIISAVGRRTTGTNVLTPAGSMTEWAEIGASPFGLNYQVIESTSGGYTVGSTGASANSSMIAAAFIDTGDSLNWIEAPLAIDGSDSTYEFVAQEHSPFLRHTLDDERIVDAARLVVSWTSNTSRTLTLQGANEADYSDAATLDTHTYTPTGGLTADILNLTWPGSSAYLYYQYLTGVENWFRVYESSLYQAGTDAASVASNALGLGGVLVQNSASSNTHFVAVSSTAGYWLPHTEATGTFETTDGGGNPESQDHGTLGATETIDAANGNHHRGTLDQACTITVAPFSDGSIEVVIYQNGTGGFGITWSGADFGGADDQPDQTASAATIYTFLSDDGTVYGFKAGGGATVDAPTISALGFVGPILISDSPSTPLVFADLIQNEAQDDLVYEDL
jgi:hypothetical protein